MSATADGISRKVTFNAWCRKPHNNLSDWKGPDRDVKSMAGFDMAAHNMDVHGGTPRGES